MSDISEIKHKDAPERIDPKDALKRLKQGNQNYSQGKNEDIHLSTT